MDEYKRKMMETYHEGLNLLHEGIKEGNYIKKNKAVKLLKRTMFELVLAEEISEKVLKHSLKILKDLKVGENKAIEIFDELDNKFKEELLWITKKK